MSHFSARNVSVTFGRHMALDDVSIELERGSVHAVIGGDGAGKSTLLEILAGLDVGQTGEVRIPEPQGIGFVPSAGGVFADLTVDENLSFVAAAYGLHGWERRASMLLERAAIDSFGHQVAARLSGGQRRKLSACLALLHEPDLLVLDEVTTGVDPVSRMELWRLIAGSAADGAAVVVATTYLDEAERMASALLLDCGRTLATGDPAEIIASTNGRVETVERPIDRATAWRSGRVWRQWSSEPPAGGRGGVVRLEDAAIIRELEAEADTTTSAGVDHGSTVPVDVSVEDRVRSGLPVEARGVSKSFGNFAAVTDLDLRVAPGEIVGLLGANGAGKTTMIKMLLGLLLPTEGAIRLFGEPASREQRRRIGYVPQNLGLYRDLTERENLEFRAEVFGVGHATGRSDGNGSSRSLPIGSVLDRSASDGRPVGDQALGVQRQIAFAVATQHQPDLLVLDEPTSGVSPLARSRLWDRIHEHADAGVAVLVSTHYMDEAAQADRLLVMSDGRLAASGTVDEVVGGRHVVEVSADDWIVAFNALDRPGRRLRLSGRTIRILGEELDDLRHELDELGVDAQVRLVDASLEEVLIGLDGAERR